MNPFPPLLGGQSQWVASMVSVRVKWGLTARLLRVPLDTGPGQHALLMWPTASPGVFWKCLTWWALGKQGFEAETVTGNRWREWTRLTQVFSPLSMPQLSFPYFFKAEEMYKLLLERTALKTSTFQLDSNLHFQLARCYLLRPTWNVSSARPPRPTARLLWVPQLEGLVTPSSRPCWAHTWMKMPVRAAYGPSQACHLHQFLNVRTRFQLAVLCMLAVPGFVLTIHSWCLIYFCGSQQPDQVGIIPL